VEFVSFPTLPEHVSKIQSSITGPLWLDHLHAAVHVFRPKVHMER
jgi:hypothetical protein